MYESMHVCEYYMKTDDEFSYFIQKNMHAYIRVWVHYTFIRKFY